MTKNFWESGGLSGLKEICQYMNRNSRTVLKLIKDEEFPACKIMGVWMAEKDLIQDWLRERIKNERQEEKWGKDRVKIGHL